MMKRLILNWLFGTDNVKDYMKLLEDYINSIEMNIELLHEGQFYINLVKKLLIVCSNHEIDINEEIKHVKLDNFVEKESDGE